MELFWHFSLVEKIWKGQNMRFFLFFFSCCCFGLSILSIFIDFSHSWTMWTAKERNKKKNLKAKQRTEPMCIRLCGSRLYTQEVIEFKSNSFHSVTYIDPRWKRIIIKMIRKREREREKPKMKRNHSKNYSLEIIERICLYIKLTKHTIQAHKQCTGGMLFLYGWQSICVITFQPIFFWSALFFSILFNILFFILWIEHIHLSILIKKANFVWCWQADCLFILYSDNTLCSVHSVLHLYHVFRIIVREKNEE